MLLALDVGNTNTVLGLYTLATSEAPATLAAHWRVSTHRTQTADEYGIRHTVERRQLSNCIQQ